MVAPNHIIDVLYQVAGTVPIIKHQEFTGVRQAALVVDAAAHCFTHVGCGIGFVQFIGGVDAIISKKVGAIDGNGLVSASSDGGAIRKSGMEVSTGTATVIGTGGDVVIKITGAGGISDIHIRKIQCGVAFVVYFKKFTRSWCNHNF